MAKPEDTHVPKFLSDEFKNIELIGEGGMGQVFGALDKTGRKVAIKVIRDEVRADSTFMARLNRESAIASRGLHPGLVQLLDKRLDDKVCYLVFEFVEGRTLSELLKNERPLSVDRAMSIFRKLATCLATLHTEGLVHRDIKPDNIMIEPDGCVRFLDFGIARGGDFDTVTQTGSILGTPAFLAPELVLGKKATAKVDVFALGLVLLDCLSSANPFHKTAQRSLAEKLSMRAKGQEHFQRPPTLPAPLWSFIKKLLQNDRGEKYRRQQPVRDHGLLRPPI